MLKNVTVSLLDYLNVAYFLKLVLLFGALYSFNVFFWGVTDPKNLYSYWLDHYANYIDWLAASILYSAQFISRLLGVEALVESPGSISSVGGARVLLSFNCLGLGIVSFWTAFVITYSGNWQRKLYWCLWGSAFIWLINCFRIALLLTALDKGWAGLRQLDHHTVFNLITYAVILMLMYGYTLEKDPQASVENG